MALHALNRRTTSGFVAGAAVVATFLWTAGSFVSAQQPPQGGQGARGQGQGRQGGGGGGGNILPLTPFEDRTGFESMFDGKSLTPGAEARAAQAAALEKERAAAKAAGQPEPGRGGRGGGGGQPQPSLFQDWDGDPKFWRIENGAIVGESAPDKQVNPNTFIIWKGGTPGDFELKAEIKMSAGNSGIQYRSKMLPPGPNGHAWRLGGYQMDMDFNNTYPGHLYEEAGRGFLTNRGTISYIAPDGTKGTIGTLETAEMLKATFKPGDWNQFHLIARGGTLVHIVNGHVTSVTIDDDLKGRSMAGLIGFQLHTGPPMKLEIRNVAIKLR
jgi:hypothetical protein